MISAKALMQGYKADPRRCVQELREALGRGNRGQPGGIRMEEFSLRSLAEECLGHQAVNDLFDPRRDISRKLLREAEEAVDSTGFSNITGQLIVNRVMQNFQSEAFIVSGLVPNVPTRLSGEKIPGIANIKDPNADNSDNLTVKEGMPYPHAGFSEDYIETPATTKRGLIIPVTREAIFFDRTGLVAGRAAQVGEILGLAKEKRLVDAFCGYSSGNDRYKWKGTYYQTYYSATDSANWTNHLDGNALVDWTDIENAELLFVNMLDPNTSEPIVIGTNGMVLMVPPQLRHTARRIVTATELRNTQGTSQETVGPNPLAGMGIKVTSSRLMYRRMIAASVSASEAAATWFYGDPGKAFAYMENWGITVTQSGMDSEVAFNQDIVLRFKASERGAAAVMEPRAMVRCRAVSTSSSSGS